MTAVADRDNRLSEADKVPRNRGRGVGNGRPRQRTQHRAINSETTASVLEDRGTRIDPSEHSVIRMHQLRHRPRDVSTCPCPDSVPSDPWAPRGPEKYI